MNSSTKHFICTTLKNTVIVMRVSILNLIIDHRLVSTFNHYVSQKYATVNLQNILIASEVCIFISIDIVDILKLRT